MYINQVCTEIILHLNRNCTWSIPTFFIEIVDNLLGASFIILCQCQLNFYTVVPHASLKMIASSPGHSQFFNVTHRKK